MSNIVDLEDFEVIFRIKTPKNDYLLTTAINNELPTAIAFKDMHYEGFIYGLKFKIEYKN